MQDMNGNAGGRKEVCPPDDVWNNSGQERRQRISCYDLRDGISVQEMVILSVQSSPKVLFYILRDRVQRWHNFFFISSLWEIII